MMLVGFGADVYICPRLSVIDGPSKFERTSVTPLHADRDTLKTNKKNQELEQLMSVRGVVSEMATVLCQEWRTQE